MYPDAYREALYAHGLPRSHLHLGGAVLESSPTLARGSHPVGVSLTAIWAVGVFQLVVRTRGRSARTSGSPAVGQKTSRRKWSRRHRRKGRGSPLRDRGEWDDHDP